MDGHRVAHSAVAQDLDAAFTTLPPVADDYHDSTGHSFSIDNG